MDILVTGGAGYIGGHVVRQLGEAGHRVVVYDNLSSGHADSVLYGEFVYGDMADEARLDTLLGIRRFSVVMHFAAHIEVAESIRNPSKYFLNNVNNSLILWRLCAKHRVPHAVFSSSAAVYGIPEWCPVSESAPLEPINPYGKSKMLSEQMLVDLLPAGGPNYAILRYFNVAGADPYARIGESHDPETHLIPRALQAALGAGGPLRINGTDYLTPDGTCVRDFIHVEDLASAHLAALDYLVQGGASTVLNCGYGHGYSVREIIETVKKVSDADLAVVEGGRRPLEPPVLVAAVDKIHRRLDWRPRYDDIDVIVRHAWQWEQKRHAMAA